MSSPDEAKEDRKFAISLAVQFTASTEPILPGQAESEAEEVVKVAEKIFHYIRGGDPKKRKDASK